MPPFKEWLSLADVYHAVAAVIGWEKAVNFGMDVWERKKPPSRAKLKLRSSGGVGVIYIPRAITAYAGCGLAELVGIEDAMRLAEKFGGLHLRFPNVVTASLARRNRAIVRQITAGSSVSGVAFSFDLTERQVRRIIRQEQSNYVH